MSRFLQGSATAARGGALKTSHPPLPPSLTESMQVQRGVTDSRLLMKSQDPTSGSKSFKYLKGRKTLPPFVCQWLLLSHPLLETLETLTSFFHISDPGVLKTEP